MRHIAILMLTADDADGQARITALRQGLEKLGWTEGRNLRIDTRWAAGDLAHHVRRTDARQALGRLAAPVEFVRAVEQ
jgi:hypothetical protein